MASEKIQAATRKLRTAQEQAQALNRSAKKYRRTCAALNATITLTVLTVFAGAITILVMSLGVISADLGGLRNLLLGFGIPALVASIISRAVYADAMQTSIVIGTMRMQMSPSELACHAQDKVKNALDDLSEAIVADDATGQTP